jgi:tRNA A-37 threonylcarbamoyl transferase component Bud32
VQEKEVGSKNRPLVSNNQNGLPSGETAIITSVYLIKALHKNRYAKRKRNKSIQNKIRKNKSTTGENEHRMHADNGHFKIENGVRN